MAVITGVSQNIDILILHDAPLDEWKGTQRSLLEYGNYLRDKGYTVLYLSPAQFKRPLGEDKIILKTEIKFKLLTYKLRHLGVYFIPNKILKQLRPRLVYVSTFNAFPYISIRQAKLIFGSFVYGPEHEVVDSVVRKVSIYFKKKLFLVLLKFYAKDSVCFHVLNETQGNWLNNLIGDNFKIHVIPPPLDCNKYFLDYSQSKYDPVFSVLYHGPLTVDKGFAYFSRIIEKINSLKSYDFIKFNIVSHGGPLFEMAVKLQKNWSNVFLFSSVSEEEKIQFYRTNHLLITPSKVENFHFVTAEAQLCGMPVISSDISGPRGIIINGITGDLVPIGDIEGFVDKIEKYWKMWKSDKDQYWKMRAVIAISAKRFCSTNTLPEFYSVVKSLIISP